MEASYAHVHSPTLSSSETIMAALLSPTPAMQFPSVTRAIAADARRQRGRLAFLLLSPPHFARALARLRSMPLPAKAALLGRMLLRALLLLLPTLSPDGAHHLLHLPTPDLDAALLLIAMCDSYSPTASSTSPVDWHALLVDDAVRNALTISGLGATPWASVAPYLDAAAKCRRFADVVSEDRAVAGVNGGGTKDGGASGGASHAVVLALPTATGDGTPCAICREEMAPGRGVCVLRPCGHRFHWPCALRWLARRNTCPCCRAELPAEDALAETRRLWRAVERMAGDSTGCA